MERIEQIKYLKGVKLALESISHKSESDSAYYECSKIAADLYQKFPTNDFRLANNLLKDYPFKGSGKRKTEIIKEFTKDTSVRLCKRSSDPLKGVKKRPTLTGNNES